MATESVDLIDAPEGFRLEASDEYPHPVDDVVNFNESVYVNGFDPRHKAGVWMRLGNRVNEGYAELSVCAYLPDGRVACQFARPEIAGNDGFDAGGLRYEVHEPLKRVGMSYTGELLLLDDPGALRDPKRMYETAPRVEGEMRLDATALVALHGGEPTAPRYQDRMMYGPQFSRGHFNQHIAVAGSMRVGDESWDLDAFGWRDHSWGPRYWQVIWYYRLFIATFGPDRAIMLLRNTPEEGPSKRIGTVMIDGRYEEVVDLDVVTEWSDEQDPLGVTLGVATANRKAIIRGRTLTLTPLRNRRKADGQVLVSRVAEAFTEFTWDDGRVGYGMMEYIERLEDGAPVGFPL
jgi:hypothetical protein